MPSEPHCSEKTLHPANTSSEHAPSLHTADQWLSLHLRGEVAVAVGEAVAAEEAALWRSAFARAQVLRWAAPLCPKCPERPEQMQRALQAQPPATDMCAQGP